jgi:single-strand DNA-binding protein
MAGSLNKVLLIGRLGADPEIKQMVNGKNVARLSLATSQTWKDKNHKLTLKYYGRKFK